LGADVDRLGVEIGVLEEPDPFRWADLPLPFDLVGGEGFRKADLGDCDCLGDGSGDLENLGVELLALPGACACAPSPKLFLRKVISFLDERDGKFF